MVLQQTELKSMKIWQPRLPAEYQEVEYIQSDANAYIDTWYKPTNNTRFVVDYQALATWVAPIWCYNNPTNYWLIINTWGGTYNIGAHYWTTYQGTGLWTCNSRIVADFNWNVLSVDGVVKYTFTATTFTMNINAWLFWWNRNWTRSNGWPMKLWSVKIYDNWTLVREFVPCYRIADSVIGLYDLVNNQFYTNSWTWTFTKWNDVNLAEKEIKRVTIRPNGQEKQIRPPVVTEVYTLYNTGSSSTDTHVYTTNLYKAGYKISQINLNGSTEYKASSSNPYAAWWIYLQVWNTNTPSYLYWHSCNYWNQASNTAVRVEWRYNSTWAATHYFDFPQGETNWYWTNTIDLTFNSSTVTDIYNNNVHTRSAVSSETQLINYLFNSNSVYVRLRAIRSSNNFIITVTYLPE